MKVAISLPKLREKAARFFDAVHDQLLQFKYRNKPYFYYYRAVVDKRAARDPQEAVGGLWEQNGKVQLDRLKKHGLMPHHTLLDIGCGSLRGGRHFIGFLEQGNYTGVDISSQVLEAAQAVLKEYGLENKKPTLLLTSDLTLDALDGRTFDYIHAQSVFSHMPQEDIEEYFSNLHKVMGPHTQFFASFFESKDGEYRAIYRKQDFFYPFELFVAMARKHGLKMDRAEDAVPGRKQPLVRITLA